MRAFLFFLSFLFSFEKKKLSVILKAFKPYSMTHILKMMKEIDRACNQDRIRHTCSYNE